ncbi:SdiA-regulated domain-containing protein [Mucilaginibacter jinjuensis]|uniref:SdiA-regulated domain-containing protein n=1 Tax=Mucilaginibacter jinjuensis TaxID=1176721 RepID=A0ABY7T6F6_9SPHI|nr:SdiA-regulated domain-containing protein [Mucilaginibacter jinjuensis]WCT11844.1 SdiA-regulated domain-containing protein [Mucilaginibacter jinjuensis]
MLSKNSTTKISKRIKYVSVAMGVFAVFALLSCVEKVNYESPQGYNLNKPKKFFMPDNLEEISGLAFNKGDANRMYVEEDENGRVYYMKPGEKEAKFSTFKQTGDFEDIAIANGQVIMLQSKGKLYTFPLSEVNGQKITNAQEFKDLLPKGEFEGLYANEEGKVYVMCKHCEMDKTSKQTTGFIFNLSNDGKLAAADTFKINVKHIAQQLNSNQKVTFHPSALAQNPRSKQWYVLSSVNKLLVILNEDFKVMQVFKLNPSVFLQPEGIAFDSQNNLYISNEGDKIDPGTVLKFTYSGK